MEEYLNWKFQTYRKTLYITLFIFFLVHLIINLIFGLEGVKILKFVVLCFSCFITALFFVSKTNNHRLVWFTSNILVFLTNFFSLLNDQVSQSFQTISGTSLSTVLTGIALLSWFSPFELYPLQVIFTFASYILLGYCFGHKNPIFSYTMVFPVGAGTIAFSYIFDSFSKKMYEVQKLNSLLAVTDSLTSVFNRQYIKNNITTNEQMNFGGCILMLDIDYFKAINDTFGHHIGDLALCNFVKTINESIRKDDILIRFGGEEFLVFLKDTELEQAKEIAERIRKTVEGSLFDPGFTCSIGLSAIKKNERFENLIKKVDKKLYEAKEGGRNRICY